MKILSDEEDQEFRQRIRDEIGFHHEPSSGWEPVEMDDPFSVPWEGNQKYEENLEKTLEVIGSDGDNFYVLAFETDQYVPHVKEEFKEKYNGNVVKASVDEIKEIADDLIILYILPKNMSWVVLFDHDGGFHFSGEIKDKAEDYFSEK